MKKLIAGFFFLTFSVLASTATLVSVNDGLNNGQDYIGPFTLSLNGDNYQAMCYDFADPASIGQTWTADTFGVNDVPDDAYFANARGYEQKYAEVAWLYSQLTNNNRTDVQYAIWDIFDPNDAPTDRAAQALDFEAKNAHLARDLKDNYEFVESVPGTGRVQAFVIDKSTAATPEPASMFLIGGGLLGLSLISKRRNKKSDVNHSSDCSHWVHENCNCETAKDACA